MALLMPPPLPRPSCKSQKHRWEIQLVGQVWLIGTAVAVATTVLHGATLPKLTVGKDSG